MSKIVLPELPFAKNALEPYISENTLNFHYGKHHQAYVTNLNNLIEGTELADKELNEIICESAGQSAFAGIFNNAAQVWNHSFYWNCLSPNGGGKPTGKLLDLIVESFGSYEVFAEDLTKAAVTQFGSGWAWLVLKDEKLEIIKTSNAETPLVKKGMTPLLTIDVWEHAYYLDYQNLRPKYVATLIDRLINWTFVSDNLENVPTNH